MSFRRIGGFWLKKDRKQRQYGAGGIVLNGKELRLAMYKNEKKMTEKDPDWLIYEQKFDKKKQS